MRTPAGTGQSSTRTPTRGHLPVGTGRPVPDTDTFRPDSRGHRPDADTSRPVPGRTPVPNPPPDRPPSTPTGRLEADTGRLSVDQTRLLSNPGLTSRHRQTQGGRTVLQVADNGVLSTALEFCQRSVNTTTIDITPGQPPFFGVLSVLSVLSTTQRGENPDEAPASGSAGKVSGNLSG